MEDISDKNYLNSLLDVNFLAQILYDFVYNNNSSCFHDSDIEHGHIDIEDVKLILPREKQIKVVNTLLNNKITDIWKYKSSVSFTVDLGTNNVMVTISVYPEEPSTNIYDYDNIGKTIAFALSDLVVNKKTRGILLHIMNVDIDLPVIRPFFKHYVQMEQFAKADDDRTVSVVVNEKFYNLELLDGMIDKMSKSVIKSIIIQVLHTLSVIQNSFPGFRHNKLTIYTCYVYQKKPETKTFDGFDYTFDDEGFEVKFSHFDDANIPGIAENMSLSSSETEQDNTYDIIYFMKSMQKCCSTKINKYLDNCIEYFKSLDKNIMLSDIIMSKSFVNIMDLSDEMTGGSKHKRPEPTVISGIRNVAIDTEAGSVHSDVSSDSEFPMTEVQPKQTVNSSYEFARNDMYNNRFVANVPDVQMSMAAIPGIATQPSAIPQSMYGGGMVNPFEKLRNFFLQRVDQKKTVR